MGYGSDLALFSEVQRLVNTQSTDATFISNCREAALAATDLIEGACNRHFYHRRERLSHDARRIDNNGDVIGRLLRLRDELITPLTVYNNGSEVVDPADYYLLPESAIAPCKDSIGLTESSNLSWQWSSNHYGDISVDGIWGWSGSWKLLTTLSADLDAVSLAPVVTSYSGLEARHVLRIDSEYLLIEGEVTSTTLLVERAWNGSTAAAHNTAAGVYVFKPNATAKRLALRLIQWYSELDDNPLFGTVTVGDFQAAVDLTAMPKDVTDMLKRLRRPIPIMAA